jgi:CIC family chloride channel protein
MDEGSHLLIYNFAGQTVDLGGATAFTFNWWIIALPTLGGLVSGLVVQLLFRLPVGQGTNVLTRAFHRSLGVLPLKGPVVKAVAAVGVISCGGSAGPEGPMAALSAAIGSRIGVLFRLSTRETRMMLVAGCAAGIGAIFQCPLGGALFAAEVLYSEPEFESEAIVPGFFASVFGYSTFILFFDPRIPVRLMQIGTDLSFHHPSDLLAYVLLGPLCGLTSIFLCKSMQTVERQVSLRSLPAWLPPALGGLATGLIACALPQVMDGQYLFTKNAMDPSFTADASGLLGNWKWPLLFASVALAKCVATACTVGSGGSGGVLGPTVFIGGVVGAFLASLLQVLNPHGFAAHLRQSLIPVGMAGVLAASMRTPLAAIVMVSEMTGSYGLIVPLMLVCVSAYVIGRRYGLNPEQVRSPADSPAHAADGLIHILESLRVEDLSETDWNIVVRRNTTLGEIVRTAEPGTRPLFAVLDGPKLVGVISVPDIERILEDPDPTLLAAVIAEDLMTTTPATFAPDNDVYEALDKFRESRHDILPVVSDDGHWHGMLSRRRVFQSLRERIESMQKLVLQEHGGLHAIDEDGHLQQLLMAVSPVETDRIQRRMVPFDVIGKSLREADVRRKYNLLVIGIELPDGKLQFPPDLDMPLQAHHRLVATVQQDTRREGGTEG